jgi:hypothetical protein
MKRISSRNGRGPMFFAIIFALAGGWQLGKWVYEFLVYVYGFI